METRICRATILVERSIGDTRNDENVIVAQLHLLFIKFHNAVLDGLDDPGRPWYQRFEHARNIVRWHYQWLVVHEFLPRILGTELAKTLIGDGLRGGVPRFRRRWLRKRFEPYVPLEFSIGAYRFGHSLVRSHYILRRDRGPIAPPQRLFPDLQGQRPLRPELVIDWRRFFRYEQLGPQHQPQNALQIDSALSGPLFDLPDGGGSLPERTLIAEPRPGVFRQARRSPRGSGSSRSTPPRCGSRTFRRERASVSSPPHRSGTTSYARRSARAVTTSARSAVASWRT